MSNGQVNLTVSRETVVQMTALLDMLASVINASIKQAEDAGTAGQYDPRDLCFLLCEADRATRLARMFRAIAVDTLAPGMAS